MDALYPIDFMVVDIIYGCKSNTLTNINGTSDIIMPLTIIIPNTVNLNNIIDMEIFIGRDMTWKIPFCLITGKIYDSAGPKKIGEYHFININDQLFGNLRDSRVFPREDMLGIPLVALQYRTLTLKLNSINNFNFKILCRQVSLQNSTKRKLIATQMEFYVFQYNASKLYSELHSIDMKCIFPGLYIKSADRIINYKLYINNQLYTSLSHELIEYYGCLKNTEVLWSKDHQIALTMALVNMIPIEIINIIERFARPKNTKEHLYCFPVSQYMRKIKNDGTGNDTIYLTGMTDAAIEIRTENGIYDGYIYSVNLNKLRFFNGICIPLFVS